MEEAPTPDTIFPKEEIISEELEIKQEKETIKLNIRIEEETMFFEIIEKEPILQSYTSKFSLDEIKTINVTFSLIRSCKDFLDYLKALANENKLNIKKNKDKNKYLAINFETEYLFKKSSIEIKLFPQRINFESNLYHIFEEIANMNIQFNNYKNENKTITDEKNNLIEENKQLKDYNKNIE